MKHIIIISILIFVFNTSCVTQKPYAEKVSQPDYNQRISVEKPGFIKKENAIGVTISLGLVGAGGYLGYNSDIIKLPNGEENLSKVGNAAIGAILGYSLSRIGTHISGKNKLNPIKDKDQWLKKLDGDFSIIEQNNQQTTLINKKVETVYKVRDYYDIKDFKKAFPNSIHNEVMLSKGFSVVERDEIPSVLQMYPNVEISDDYKLRYYELSADVNELKRAKSLFPGIKERFNICENVNTIIAASDKSELDYLIQEYGDSECREKVEDALVRNCSTINTCIDLSKQYPLLKKDIARKSISLPKTVNECIILNKTFPSVNYELGNKAMSFAKGINEFKSISSTFPNVKTEANKRMNKLINEESKIEYNKLFPLTNRLPEENLELVNNIIKKYPNSSEISEEVFNLKNKFESMLVLDSIVRNFKNETLKERFSYTDQWLDEFSGYKHPNHKDVIDIKKELIDELDQNLNSILSKSVSIESKYSIIYNNYIANQEDGYFKDRGKRALKKLAQSSISISDNISQILGNRHVPLNKHEEYRVVRPILGSDYVEIHTYYTGGYDYETITGYSSTSTITNKSNLPIKIHVELTAEVKEEIVKGEGAIGGALATLFNGAVTLFNQRTGNAFVEDMSDSKNITIPPRSTKKVNFIIPATDFRDGNLYYHIKRFGEYTF